jgi:hypothetical protein
MNRIEAAEVLAFTVSILPLVAFHLVAIQLGFTDGMRSVHEQDFVSPRHVVGRTRRQHRDQVSLGAGGFSQHVALAQPIRSLVVFDGTQEVTASMVYDLAVVVDGQPELQVLVDVIEDGAQ